MSQADDFSSFFNVPGRPEHPDLMKLSDVILKLDGRATEGGESFEAIVGDVIDVKSLSYMAQQRIRWAYPNISEEGASAMAAMFLNGFLAGFFWHDRKEQP